jgi:hypothetical protein
LSFYFYIHMVVLIASRCAYTYRTENIQCRKIIDYSRAYVKHIL